MAYTRTYLLILDGLGVGNAPDAADYGDEGSDTLAHIAQAAPMDYPNLARLGLGNLYEEGLPGLPREPDPSAHHGRLTEVSPGKDTTTGHWELTGLVRDTAAPTFPSGFPKQFIDDFTNASGRAVIGNYPASGTEIIQELGAEHVNTGALIVYTSADSVLQIAAHIDVVPLIELYGNCRIARSMLTGELAVDRVIARPFVGSVSDGFARTPDRRDYALPPPGDTVLNRLKDLGFDVVGVGKIKDIFAGRGITASKTIHGNNQLMQAVSSLSKDVSWKGLVFCNLVDFDMLFGHRNDPQGYADAMAQFDRWLGGFLSELGDDELVIITADHGNDPTTKSTDHSREQVPVLVTSNAIASRGGTYVDATPGLFHVGKTILAALGVDGDFPGESMI